VPSINAFRPNAVTAESIAAKIDAGDKQFFDVPEWKLQRERLLKQYEALLNPRQRTFAPIDASKYTPESIRAFNVSGDQSDLVAKEKSDKAVANINAADYTPTSVQAFSVSGDYADLVPKEKPIAKSDFDKLLDESRLSDPEKQAMRIAKLQKETAKPEQKAEARSEFEKLLDNSDLTEDQKAEARRAKITKETRIPPTGGDGGEKFPTCSVTVIVPTDPTGKKVIVVTAKRAITEGLTPFTSVPKEGATTEGERKAATLLQRLQFSESQLVTALGEDPNAAKPGLLASAVAKLSDPAANLITPVARQRVEAAQLDILDAALTLGTGAAYTNEQLKGYAKSYFPQIGDKPKNIEEKQARLNNVIQAAKIAAGRAAPNAAPQGTDGFKYLGKEGKK
jgi:hypothetical protein